MENQSNDDEKEWKILVLTAQQAFDVLANTGKNDTKDIASDPIWPTLISDHAKVLKRFQVGEQVNCGCCNEIIPKMSQSPALVVVAEIDWWNVIKSPDDFKGDSDREIIAATAAICEKCYDTKSAEEIAKTCIKDYIAETKVQNFMIALNDLLSAFEIDGTQH